MKIDSPNALGTSTGFGIPTGGTTNQILSKVNSSDFNTQWTTLVNQEWVDGGTITIGATTTAPTKGSMVYDDVRYRQINSTTYEVEYNFAQSTAGTAGNGTYLFSLPSGITWGAGVLTTQSNIVGTYVTRTLLTNGQVLDAGARLRAMAIIPYTSTQFRIIGSDLEGSFSQVGSSYYALNNAGQSFRFSFYTTV
jgi:hypothetical protein